MFWTTVGLLWACWTAAAQAMPSVDLVFVELNGTAIPETSQLDVLPGDLLGVEMRMTTDERGVSGYSVSVDFDSAGDGSLLLEGFADVLPFGLDFPLGATTPFGPGEPLGVPGFVKHFTAATFDPDPPTRDVFFTIGTLSFSVTDAIRGGPATVAPGIFFVGVDEVISNGSELIGGEFEFFDLGAEFAFHAATLHAVPEPASAALLAGGLTALGWLRRRR